ncbi:MAG: hypothetical protein ACPL8I_08840 [Chloroflexaceae bacterium]
MKLPTSEHDYQMPAPANHSLPAIVPGVIVIAAGVGLLLHTLGWLPLPGNWWALTILIPVGASAWSAWRRAEAVGFWDRAAVTTLASGGFPLAVALIFLFNLDWAVVWPVFPIIAGAVMLAGVLAPHERA